MCDKKRGNSIVIHIRKETIDLKKNTRKLFYKFVLSLRSNVIKLTLFHETIELFLVTTAMQAMTS